MGKYYKSSYFVPFGVDEKEMRRFSYRDKPSVDPKIWILLFALFMVVIIGLVFFAKMDFLYLRKADFFYPSFY